MAEISALAKKVRHGIYWRMKRLPLFYQIHNAREFRERDILLGTKFPQLYSKYSSEPVDPKKVIFVENHNSEVSDNFLPLLEDLKRDGSYTVHVHFLKEFVDPWEVYVQNCARLVKDAATTSCIFLNDACRALSCVPMREETTMIQLWHACGAFKRFGYSTLNQKFGPSKRNMEKHTFYGYGNLDYVTVSSPEVAWAYTEAMELEGKKTDVTAVGVSRTDRFFDQDFLSESVSRIRERYPAAEGKKIVLFAPTFRGRAGFATTPDFSRFDLNALHQAAGDQFFVLIKHHPFVARGRRPKIPEQLQDSFAVDVTEEYPIDVLLCAADVVITDYSSLIFEYSLLNRPMLFYAYDLKDYYDWRGFYYDYDELTPGPVCKSMEELIDALTHLDERFDSDEAAAFREKFMSACDGHATERIEELAFGRRL